MTTQRLRRVAETDAHEGPVYAADEGALYFTTVRRERVAIKRLALADGSVTVVRADANTANGMALDRDGSLVVCEQGTLTEPARIARVDRGDGRRRRRRRWPRASSSRSSRTTSTTRRSSR
jgi:gluconolactonase